MVLFIEFFFVFLCLGACLPSPPHTLLLCSTYLLGLFCVFSQALEAVNARLRELYPDSEELFDIVLVTYNHAHVGVRLINTINYHSKYPYPPQIRTLSTSKF